MAGATIVERGVERILFASRWLLAPLYVGLVASLGLLVFVFMRELWHFASQIRALDEKTVVVSILTLVDITFTGNLLIMVIFAGYENFVSKLDGAGERDRPPWMGQVDFSELKLKLISSIVAISGIHLLARFMTIETVDPGQLRWMITIHLAFIVSGVLLALMDWLATHATRVHHITFAHPHPEPRSGQRVAESD